MLGPTPYTSTVNNWSCNILSRLFFFVFSHFVQVILPLQCTLPEAAEVVGVVASQFPGHANKTRSGQNETIDTSAIGDASEESFFFFL